MSQETIKLAFIGCGGIARRHVRAMKDLVDRGRTGFTVTAVCDSNVEAAQNLAEELHEQLGMTPRIYNDYQEMLGKEELDGADLCLPHGLHHSFTIACMEAGVHVLTKQAALSCARAGYGIRVNCIQPGYVLTPGTESRAIATYGSNEAAHTAMAARNPMNLPIEGDDIAWGAVYLASDEARAVNGIELVIDGGILATLWGV